MYFEQTGWAKEAGVPTRITLEDVRLSWAAEDLDLS